LATVLVVDVTGRAGRAACRSLRRAGHRVVGTAGDTSSAARGGGLYCHVVRVMPQPTVDPTGFLAAVDDVIESDGVDVAIQTDNEAATQLFSLHPPNGAVAVGPDAAQFAALCDKARLGESAAAAGVDSPRTVVVREGDETADLPTPPVIVKPVAAGTGAGALHSDGPPRVAHDERERDRFVADLVSLLGAAVVQEQVVGNAWRVHFVADASAFVGVPVLTRLSVPRDAGMSTVQYVPSSAPEALFNGAEALVRASGYVGPGSVQFFERDGCFLVHDVNLRLPATVALSIAAGLDLPRLAVERALGRSALGDVRPNDAVYVWLGAEARLLVEELRASPRRGLHAAAQFASTVGGALVTRHGVVDHAPLRALLR
jgi:carbamoyl-phosphate synthase large subunit